MAPRNNMGEKVNVNGKRHLPEPEGKVISKKLRTNFNPEARIKGSPEREGVYSRKATKMFDAVERGDLEIVKELLQESGPAIKKAKCRSTLLHQAAANNHVELVTYLLRFINPNVINIDGQTPAHLAAANGHTEVLKILLSDQDMNPHKKDKDQRTFQDLLATPLFKAVLWWDKRQIKDLLSLGADPDYHAMYVAAGALSRELKVTSARQLAQSLGRQAILDMFPEMRLPSVSRHVVQNDESHHSIFLPKTLGPLRLHASPTLSAITGSDVYKTSINTKGYVTILSYGSFQDRPELVLEASQDDSNNLFDLFDQMGYKVDVHHNLSAEKTKDTLNDISQMEHLNEVGCAIFYISSHATSPNTFLTSDMKQLNTEWVLNMFQDSECPQLKDKPKIFIFDLCQGYCNPDDTRPLLESLPVRVQEPLQDMLCLCSNSNGFVTYSFSREGSAFNTAFCRTLANHSSKKEIHDLYRELLTEYRKSSPSAVPQMRNVGFMKKFYF